MEYCDGESTGSPCRSTSPSCAFHRGDAASERISACDGWSKLPGTCQASQAPEGSAEAHSRSSARYDGTHWNAALLTTTSVSDEGCQASMSPTRNVTPGGDADATQGAEADADADADAIISGDESMPSTVAPGQRAASSAVSVPAPQPRSTTRRGASAPTRATRSRNGRSRSPANLPYCAGSHRKASSSRHQDSISWCQETWHNDRHG